MEFGPWHEGVKYDVRIQHSLVDTYPNNFRCIVEIRSRESGKVVQRIGVGKYIGNFSPIWVSWMGLRWQLDELLRQE